MNRSFSLVHLSITTSVAVFCLLIFNIHAVDALDRDFSENQHIQTQTKMQSNTNAVLLSKVKVVSKSLSETTCYGADTKSFWWCSGYEDAGYVCNEDKSQCASSQCLSDCEKCSVVHQNAVLDSTTGQCCESLSEDGKCVNPLKSEGPFNPIYGYPNGMGSLIVEGPAEYKNGPKLWPKYQDGANGWTTIAPVASKDIDCPKIPNELVDLGLDPSKYTDLIPISLGEHGAGADFCEISCNVTLIEETGMDPCQFGSYDVKDFEDDEKALAEMKCFSGGDTWLGAPGLGVCGYPCRMVNYTTDPTTYCDPTASSSSIQTHCFIECDPRKFPKENKSFPKAYLRID